MQRRLRPRSMHILGTCEKRTTAQCQILIVSAGKTRFFPEVAIALTQVQKKVNRPRCQSPLLFDIRNI